MRKSILRLRDAVTSSVRTLDNDEDGSFLETVMILAVAATMLGVAYKVFWSDGGSVSVKDKLVSVVTNVFTLIDSSISGAK